MTFNQQIEIAKLQAVRSFEERRSADSDYTTQLTHLRTEIDNRLELAKLWQVSDRSDPIFREIQSLMAEKRVLLDEYKNAQFKLNSKRRHTDAMLDDAFDSRRRGNPTLLSENSCNCHDTYELNTADDVCFLSFNVRSADYKSFCCAAN